MPTPAAADLPARHPAAPAEHPVPWRLQAAWADSEAQVRAAQRLRFAVFSDEMGARLPAAALASGRDADRFDPSCEHLLVWASDPLERHPRRLVGTYRVLPPDGARRLGGLYADQEFELAPLNRLRPRMIELGRACVHADWRTGGVILCLWSALGRFMVQRRFDSMVGCASVGLADGGDHASALWRSVRASHLAAPEWQVEPRTPLALRDGAAAHAPVLLRAMPPLIKGYLRGGARVLGAPAYDASFHTADLPILMRLDELTPRYRAQFLLP